MNLLNRCYLRLCRLCSDCFYSYPDEQLANSPIARRVGLTHCRHLSKRKHSICADCFRALFLYDRFLIRHLYSYLCTTEEGIEGIDLKRVYHFGERILAWQEFVHYMDFTIEVCQILLATQDLAEESNASFQIDMPNETVYLDERRETEPSLTNLLQQYDIVERTSLNATSIYELIKDAYFFTALQANVQTTLSSASEVRCTLFDPHPPLSVFSSFVEIPSAIRDLSSSTESSPDG